MTTAVKERPILFSSPMVRAILDGRKTVTRRVVKGSADFQYAEKVGDFWRFSWDDSEYDTTESTKRMVGVASDDRDCPYGQPGDRLWVRETFWMPVQFDQKSPRQVAENCLDAGYSKPWCPLRYEADGETKIDNLLGDFGGAWGKTRVSIHMPRWASRITLEVESVRVERLQEITSEEAFAEGFEDHVRGHVYPFRELWHKLNGPGSWDANPWVWVVKFRRVEL